MTHDPLIGREIGGCRVLERIGRGAMATVYRAEQVSLGRTVALKILDTSPEDDEAALGRFFREARSAARLVSPSVVQIHDVGVDGGVPYIVMEHVDGRTLHEVLQERGRLPSPEALRIVGQVARALMSAQGSGLVHRDIKPANIMLARSGEAKLADFGLAKLTAPGAGGDTRRGSAGTQLGTPYYMSPEQVEEKPVDIRTDIYSLGATFYHLVTGRVPFGGSSVPEVMRARLLGDPPPASRVESSVPETVSRLIGKMMAREPSERFPSAKALLSAIESELERAGPGAGPGRLFDRRSYMRVAADFVAEVKKVAASEEVLRALRAKVRNLSGGGAFVECADLAPVDSVVEVRFRMVPSAPEVRALGVVKWTRAAPGRSGMGIQFVEMDPSARDNIDRYVGEHARRQALTDLTRSTLHRRMLEFHREHVGEVVPVGELASSVGCTAGILKLILAPFETHGLVSAEGDSLKMEPSVLDETAPEKERGA